METKSQQGMRQLPDWASYLVAAGRRAPSADNSQPWRFSIDNGSLRLGVDHSRAAEGLGADHPAVSLALGACAENVVQAALAAGFPASALHFYSGDGPSGEVLRVTAPGKSTEIKYPKDLALADRHTNRTAFAAEPIRADLLASIAETSIPGSGIKVFQEPTEIQTFAGLLGSASEARFRDEKIHRWLSASLRFSPEEAARGDGLDIRTLALPPGGALILRLVSDWRRMAWLNRFGAYKLLAAIEAASFKACGAIIVVLADGWERQRLVAAGRVMERVWIQLNSAGISVHPYYVLPDQFYRLWAGKTPPELRAEVTAFVERAKTDLDLGGQVPAMLLRAGRAKAEVPRSGRLPAERLISAAKT